MVKGGAHANGHLISMPTTENIPMVLKEVVSAYLARVMDRVGFGPQHRPAAG